MPRPDEHSVEVGGVAFAIDDLDSACRYVLSHSQGRRRLRVHFCNAYTIVRANKDPALLAALRTADRVFPDGIGVVWAMRFLHGVRTDRVSGPDLMWHVLESAESPTAHYLYGSRPEVVLALRNRLAARFSKAAFTSESPPFRELTEEEEEATVRRINGSGAQFVWVGLGTPKQDLWAARLRPLLDSALILTVGAAFEFHSGHARRAPLWMRRAGLEWLHRLSRDPRRLLRRYAIGNLEFLRIVLQERFREE